MRWWLTILFLGGVAATAAAEPIYQQQLIFPLQPKHVHSSSIVECPNGDLMAAWFSGSGERTSPDVVIQGARLKHGATAWSERFPMADTPNFPDCNPVLFVGPQKDLWLFWIAVPADRWEDSLLRYRKAQEYSGDGPPHWCWQDLILLKPGDRFAEQMAKGFREVRPTLPGPDTPQGQLIDKFMKHLLRDARSKSIRQRGWMTRCHLLVLPSGRILLPLYSDGFLACLMAISDDGGKTWRASSPIIGAGLNQPSVVRRRDGTLVAYMREEEEIKRRVLRSESHDDGETWSVAESIDFPNPNSSLEALALADGRWILVYNDSEVDRHTLAVTMSDDEGRSWKWQRHLENTPGGQFHYPSVIQTRDGQIHVTYTYQPGPTSGKSIKHVVFNPDWIKAGDGPATSKP